MQIENMEKTQQDFEKILEKFPTCRNGIIGQLGTMEALTQGLYKKIYTTMPVADIITINPQIVAEHIRQVERAYNFFDYCADIPEEIFLNYVLPYRVNDEHFELYNGVFYRELASYVRYLPMVKAALEVNYHCLSCATYKSTDDRTLSPLATVRRSFGRCGEESVFTVAALRSCGIPARQCYVPFWAHCDDNHAWVEFWAEGQWHFMGACEPEERENIGWFNYAASKATVVRHRVLGVADIGASHEGCALYKEAFTTRNYGDVVKIPIYVEKNGLPAQNVPIWVFVINYGKPSCVATVYTDEKGEARFEGGQGDFLFLTGNARYYDCAVFRHSENMGVRLSIGANPQALELDLMPPKGKMPHTDYCPTQEHGLRIIKANKKRESEKEEERGEYAGELYWSGKNKGEILKFIRERSLSPKEKREILKAVCQKDFADISYECLMNMLVSFDCDEAYSDSWKGLILPLRVKNEHLYPHRAYVRKFFESRKMASPQGVYDYLKANIQTFDSLSYPGVIPDVKAALAHGISTSEGIKVHFVQICRALNMPARLNQQTDAPEYYVNDKFIQVEPKYSTTVSLDLSNITGRPMRLGKDVNVSEVFEGGFKNFNFDEEIKASRRLLLPRGLYAVTSSRRQIDGSVTARLEFVNMFEMSKRIQLSSLPDKTGEKLMDIELLDVKTPTGSLIEQMGERGIIAYIKSGEEPTEHLINEMIDKAITLKRIGIKVVLFAESGEVNSTIKKLLDLKAATLVVGEYKEYFGDLREKMGVGDERLPLCAAVRRGKSLFALANYNVGTVEIMVNILDRVVTSSADGQVFKL